MRRRDFIAGLGGAAWALAARAQQGERMRRIGVLCESARACKSPNLKQTGEVNMTFYGFR
jgi:hypothetical protein